MTQAVILAAGFGSRLRPLTDERPKALLPFGREPLIARTLDALVRVGVKSAAVTGHTRQPLEAYLTTRRDLWVVTVENSDYASTNTLASLACAAAWLHDDFVLRDGDLVFEPSILDRLSGPGTRVAVRSARRCGRIPCRRRSRSASLGSTLTSPSALRPGAGAAYGRGPASLVRDGIPAIDRAGFRCRAGGREQGQMGGNR